MISQVLPFFYLFERLHHRPTIGVGPPYLHNKHARGHSHFFYIRGFKTPGRRGTFSGSIARRKNNLSHLRTLRSSRRSTHHPPTSFPVLLSAFHERHEDLTNAVGDVRTRMRQTSGMYEHLSLLEHDRPIYCGYVRPSAAKVVRVG